jgi:flagellar assembly protein FliH
MAEQDTLVKPQKFLFDQHSFDEDHLDEEEEEIPPPPVFSEQELEDARSAAYEKGRNDGLNEAHQSREQNIEVILDRIADSFSQFYACEAERSDVFEAEAVSLSRTIFEKLFPALNAAHGLDEIFAIIQDVIKAHQNKPEILISVAPEYAAPIQDRLDKMSAAHAQKLYCHVSENDALKPGECQLSWKHGRAIRNASELA